MKVTFNRSALQEGLALVGSIIPARTPKPILQCIRILADKDAVQLSATDLEVGITYQVDQVQVGQEGDVVLPCDKISSIIRESADEVIEMEEEESTVHFRGSDSHFTIYGHDSAQYPAVPTFDGKGELTVSLGKLQDGIEQTLFAAARESTRYALNGVLWEVSGKKLTLVATDGRRLARSIVPLDKAASVPEGKLIVPAKTMSLLDKIPGAEDTQVSVRFVDNQIVLACDSIVISSNLVEGNFPNYEDIIPKDCDKKLTLQTAASLSAVRRAALLASEDSKGIRLALSKGSLEFTSRAPETGDAQIQMAIDYDGAEMEVGFNPQFLTDVLRVLKDETFELHLGQADRPGVIKSGSHFLYIVMPVNL